MPNETKINEGSSIALIIQELVNMFSMYEPYIASWAITNGPLMMKLAGLLMGGYFSTQMIMDMIYDIGSKKITSKDKTTMINKRIKELEQEQKAKYLRENKQVIKEVYNRMKAERLLENFDRKSILRLIIEALSPEEVNALVKAGRTGNNDVFKKLMKQHHPDRNKGNPESEENFRQTSELQNFFIKDADVNKKNFENPEVWPDNIKDIMKNAGVTGKPAANQQAQGGQQEASPEVKQTIAQIAKKQVDKYDPLYKQFVTILGTFKEQPAKFFEDQAFIDNLVKIAGSLNEEIDPEIQKELGLQPEKTKENIQKIVAGLEKIRQQLLQALSKKGELVKQRPEPGQAGGDQQKQLNEQGKGDFLKTKEWKDYASKNLKKRYKTYDYNKTSNVLKQELESKGIGWGSLLKEYLEFDDLREKFVKAGAISQEESKLFTKQIVQFLQQMAKKHKWSTPKKADTQDSKPMPLVPAAIEKIEGNALTIQGKDGNAVAVVSKEEAKATYDIIAAADKFVRIYAVLLQYLAQIAPEEVQKITPNKQILQLDPSKPLVEPEKAPLLIGTTPEKEKEGEGGGEITGDSDDGMRYPRKELLERYTNVLELPFDEFEKSFLNVPMLEVQSSLYADLEAALIAFKEEADGMAGAFSSGEGEPEAAKRDDLYEQIISKVHNLITERREVEFDEKGMTLFKSEYKQLLKLAKFLNQTVDKVELVNLEKVGGDELVRQIRKIAEMLQESIGKVHDVVLNELRADVEAGKKLTEEEGDETPPTDEPPKESGIQDPAPYDAHDTEGEAKRVQANKRSWEQKVKDVKNVYERVVNQLTLLNQLLDSNEPRIEARKVNQLIQTSLKSLDSIRTFFPSQSPFGKRMPEGTSPQKYIKQMKRKVKQVVSDIVDIARQLKSTISNKPALQEEIQGVFKDLTDEQNVHKFAAQLKMTSAMLQDYFDAPSKIGEVFANRSAKISNAEDAAAINDEGNEAVKTGKAAEPEYDKQEEDSSKSSQINSKLKSFSSKFEKIQDRLSGLSTRLKDVVTMQGSDFGKALAILLNKFPDLKQQTNEQEIPIIKGTGSETSFKLFNITPQKIKYINSLIKIDKGGSLSIFFNALKNDAKGSPILKKELDRYFPEGEISFNMSYAEAANLIKLGAGSKDSSPNDEEISKETEAEVEERVKQKTKEENVDMEDLKNDQQKKEDIAQEAADEVVDNLEPEEQPKTEEEKQELRKTLIDLALQDIEEMIKGDSENISVEDAKKILNAKSFKKLEEFINDMDDYFNKNIKGKESEFANNEKLVKELIQRYESAMQRINIMNEQLGKAQFRKLISDIVGILNPVMDFIKKGERVEQGIMTLRNAFDNLNHNISLFKQAVEQQDEQAVQQAMKDIKQQSKDVPDDSPDSKDSSDDKEPSEIESKVKQAVEEVVEEEEVNTEDDIQPEEKEEIITKAVETIVGDKEISDEAEDKLKEIAEEELQSIFDDEEDDDEPDEYIEDFKEELNTELYTDFEREVILGYLESYEEYGGAFNTMLEPIYKAIDRHFVKLQNENGLYKKGTKLNKEQILQVKEKIDKELSKAFKNTIEFLQEKNQFEVSRKGAVPNMITQEGTLKSELGKSITGSPNDDHRTEDGSLMMYIDPMFRLPPPNTPNIKREMVIYFQPNILLKKKDLGQQTFLVSNPD